MNCDGCFLRLQPGHERVVSTTFGRAGALAREARGAGAGRGAAGALGVDAVRRRVGGAAVGFTRAATGGTSKGGSSSRRPTAKNASATSSGTSPYQLPLARRLGMPDS